MFSYYNAKKEIDIKHGAATLYTTAKVKTFYAYTAGVAHGPFSDAKEAQKISKNIETVFVENDEVTKKLKAYHEEISELGDRWHKELREEYSYLSDKLYAHIYSKAYDDGHHAGCDEVYNCFVDLAEFAEEAIKIDDRE